MVIIIWLAMITESTPEEQLKNMIKFMRKIQTKKLWNLCWLSSSTVIQPHHYSSKKKISSELEDMVHVGFGELVLIVKNCDEQPIYQAIAIDIPTSK